MTTTATTTTAPPPQQPPRRTLWSLFPLYTYPSTPTRPTSTTSSQPTLYVPLGRCTPSTSTSTSTTWCSSNVRSLQYQIELLFRGVTDFNTIQLSERDWWGNSDYATPLLSIPKRNLLITTHDELQTYLSTMHAFEWEDTSREKRQPFDPYTTEEKWHEAKLWMTLLERDLFAAVELCALISRQASRNDTSRRPLFSHLLERYISSQRINCQAQEIAQASTTTSSSQWTSSLPSLFNFSFGFLNSTTPATTTTSSDTRTNYDQVGEKYIPFPSSLDSDGILSQGVECINDLSHRLESSESWFLDATAPTRLDALLFALLHSILADDNVLRTAVLKHDNLVQWTRRVYDSYVKQRELQWRAQ
ncbi:unnamed protein product [Sympodiomycopsis kandeliae]